MKSLALLLTLLAAAPHSHALAAKDRPGFVNTFWDDFLQPPDSLPSPSKWLINVSTSHPSGAPNWGNGELETCTNSSRNLRVTHAQNLALIPRRNRAGGWTSARIETVRTDFAAVPGGRLLVEARIRLGSAPEAQQQGIWPAFWALGASFRGNFTDWPGASEWDVMENRNGQATAYQTVHCGSGPGGPCNENSGRGNGGVAITRADWHVYALQVDRCMVGHDRLGTWRDETLTFFVDGKSVLALTGAAINDETAWDRIAHQGHFLLLSVAVGGFWPGFPNNQTVDGQAVQMGIDYVGVWNSA